MAAGPAGTAGATARTMTCMTRLMQSVIDRLRSVPDAQQDQLAAFVLHELEQDERWATTSATHTNGLERLIGGVLADDDRGRCEPLEPGNL